MENWDRYIAYRCVVGSRAFGLSHESSDTDVRGFYLPPTPSFWRFDKPPEQLENEERQECFWELEKFLRLGLACNPNVLECLYTPLVEHASPLAEELLELRSAFLSKRAYERYKGYADDQFRRLLSAREAGEPVRWKHAMHLLRLLLAGAHLLETGVVLVDVSHERTHLLAVSRGEWEWEQVEEWRDTLASQLDEVWKGTSLPAEPERDRIESFLLKARRSMLEAEECIG